MAAIVALELMKPPLGTAMFTVCNIIEYLPKEYIKEK